MFNPLLPSPLRGHFGVRRPDADRRVLGRHRFAVKTFAETYCAGHRCAPRTFTWQAFWRCLHPCAVPVAPLALWLFPQHFETDWELIRRAARCSSLRQVDEEIRDFVADPANRSWWRRVARIRLSTQRVRRLARCYLPAGIRPPPGPRLP